MTGDDAQPTSGGGAANGLPWTLELLADLHAGVFTGDAAAALRAGAATDPQAVAILKALDATRADLTRLPPLRIPDDVAARIDAALLAEPTSQPAAAQPPILQPATSQPATSRPATAVVTDLAGERRRRGLLVGAGLLATAAAVAGIVGLSGLTGGHTTGTPLARVTNSGDQVLQPLVLSGGTLGGALDGTLGVRDFGPLAAGGRLDACLQANGVNPATTQPLGAREVVFDGRPGVLVVLPTGRVARYRLLVVASACGPGNPAVLADTTIGR